MKLFEELKRRNVIRMAAVYVAVGWLLTQVAATLEGEGGCDRFFYWSAMAEIAALKGEPDLALEHLQKVVERGYADLYGFYAPAFDSLRDDDRFNALEKRVRDKANAERVKLGLTPL